MMHPKVAALKEENILRQIEHSKWVKFLYFFFKLYSAFMLKTQRCAIEFV